MPQAIKKKSHEIEKTLLGVLITITSSLCYAFYSMFAKIAQEGNVPVYQITFFSFFVSWLALVPFLMRKKKISLKTEHFFLHVLRLIFGVGIIYLLVPALKLIPLVDGVMLNNSAPLFIPLIAFLWIKQPLNHSIWIALLCGLIGIGLILKPHENIFNVGGMLALASGFCMAFSWVSIRKLTYTEPVLRILFYFLTMATLITAIPLFWTWSFFPFMVWLDLLVIGFFYFATTALFAYACKLISVTLVSILFYFTIVFTALLDWLVWHRLPDLFTVIGILLVILGGILSILLEKKTSSP